MVGYCMAKKLLIIDAAALGWNLLQLRGATEIAGLTFRPAETVFPALTCPVQASFRTTAAPAAHGMIANGLFFRELGRAMFWEQSAAVVAGERIWSSLRRGGGKVGMLFWQQSMGECADMLLTPAPIHKHHGGIIQDCYCKPDGLYESLCRTIGSPFKLRHYWGPLASARAGDWIARAGQAVLADRELAPDVCFVYLPTLDYDLQRFGPGGGTKVAAALDKLEAQLALLLESAGRFGYETIVFGDYAITEVTRRPVLPNRILHQNGLFRTREIAGRLYPDFHASRALAVADHQVAHVYVRDRADIGLVRETLERHAGSDRIAEILDAGQQERRGLRHANSGELVLVAAQGSWLAYPWWSRKSQAPDFASHVDIHNKPGYDPCELFASFGWPPMSVSQDTGRIRGSHGLIAPGREVAWASTMSFDAPPATLLELAAATRNIMNEEA